MRSCVPAGTLQVKLKEELPHIAAGEQRRKWTSFWERGEGSFKAGVGPSFTEQRDSEVCLELLLGHSEPGR